MSYEGACSDNSEYSEYSDCSDNSDFKISCYETMAFYVDMLLLRASLRAGA